MRDGTHVPTNAGYLILEDAVHAVHAAAEGVEGPTAVSTKHFEEAMATARRSVTDADLAKYDAYAAKQKVSADAVDGEPAKAFSFDDDGDEAMFE